MIAKSIRGFGTLFEWRFGSVLARRGRRGEEGKHSGSVALHAHLPALVHEATSEVVRAPLVVACVTDALDLDSLGEGVPCDPRRKRRSGEVRHSVLGIFLFSRSTIEPSFRKERIYSPGLHRVPHQWVNRSTKVLHVGQSRKHDGRQLPPMDKVYLGGTGERNNKDGYCMSSDLSRDCSCPRYSVSRKHRAAT